MAEALPALIGLQAGGTILGGINEQKVAGIEAAQLKQNAGQALASSQRQAEIARNDTKLVQSRQRAVAGGSGAGAGDVTVQDVEAETGARGEYNALTALYQGKSTALNLETQAAMAKYAGNQALTSSLFDAAGQAATAGINASGGMPGSSPATIGASGMSMMSKYGGKLPPWMSPTSMADPNSMDWG